MNAKITLSELADEIASVTNSQRQEVETLLKELFSLISASLTTDDKVKIKKFGTFKVVEVEQRKSVDVNTGEEIQIPSYRKVSFTPDKEIAEAVNSPFAAFETVEISDNVSDEMLNNVDDEELSLKDVAETIQDENDELSADDDVSLSNEDSKQDEFSGMPSIQWAEDEASDSDDISAENNGQFAESPIVENSEVVSNRDNESQPGGDNVENYDDDDEHENKIGNKGFVKGFIYGLSVAIVLIVIGVGAWWYLSPATFHVINTDSSKDAMIVSDSKKAHESGKIENAGEVADDQSKTADLILEEKNDLSNVDETTMIPSTEPSDKVVYDTISKTRFLTTMARAHYGNYHLWPYIYEENKAILGHPDRIRPGTVIVIPPASKYGIDANDKECIKNAKAKGVEIYERYR